MVESAVTKPAEMCLRLQAIHRWCVTGTPIQRDLGGRHVIVHVHVHGHRVVCCVV